MEESVMDAAGEQLLRISEAERQIGTEKVDTAANYSPLVLAYMGDAVYELLIRNRIVRSGNRQVNKMHHEAVHYVKAATQARLAQLLEAELSEDERAVMKRGRNAHSNTMAKNASMIDYRMATAFEALLGYLWLNDAQDRLSALVRTGLARFEAEERGKQ